MSIEDYLVENDHFTDDENTVFCFPCNSCTWRHMGVSDHPCRVCGHNASKTKDENESDAGN
jgi:hypothetical protein